MLQKKIAEVTDFKNDILFWYIINYHILLTTLLVVPFDMFNGLLRFESCHFKTNGSTFCGPRI